ncbi:MAG: tetratricopeptide (TPR) repeat protein, partial [Planctomycetota bacterium]
MDRYDQIQEIPNNGTARVYRARDAKTGAAVVIKSLRHVDTCEFEALRSEVNILRRINHSGIVQIHEADLDHSPPWYAMEFIEGGTLDDLRQHIEVGMQPCPAIVTRSLKLLSRLCEPLAFLHSQGIVHRDLKPQNIGIRADDQPVIVDFDLASQFGAVLAHESLESGGAIIGSIPYMSPEQARGEYVDARSDLYSLGCMMYEAITGHPPFVGKPIEVVRQHLETEPEAIADIDPRLANLISRLLAKNVRQRVGYAADVGAELHKIGIDPHGTPPKHTQTYLYRPKFAGRDFELKRLCVTLENASAGAGHLLLLTGESGSGKTRIAMEATREAAARHFRVITGECSPTDYHMGRAPLHPLRPFLRAVATECMAGGPDATARLLGSRAKILAHYEPTLANVPDYSEQKTPSRISTDGSRERVLAALTVTLRALAREKPVLVILDDLHWADDLTLAWIDRLTSGFLNTAPVLLLGTCRSEEMGPELCQIAPRPTTSLIELQRLSPVDVRSIVTDMLGTERLPHQLINLLMQESDGNPFFVCEYLRAAVEGRFLDRDATGHWVGDFDQQVGDSSHSSLPLPACLRTTLQQRLRGFDFHTLRILEAAAVLGREFLASIAEVLAGVEPKEAAESFRSLTLKGVIEASEPGRYRFVHDMIREVAYSEIPKPRMITLHRGAALTIEGRCREQNSFRDQYVELAHHWSKATDGSKAISYFTKAGAYALETGAYKDAHYLILQALVRDEQRGRHLGSLERVRWLRMLANATFCVGDVDASISYSSDALADLGERLPKSSMRWLQVVCFECVKRIYRRPKRSEEPSEEMREITLCYAQLSTSRYYEGNVLAATATLLRALAHAEHVGNKAVILGACARLALVGSMIRLDRVARHGFARAHRTAEMLEDRGGRGVSLYLEAQYQQGLGRWQKGYALADEAANLFEDIQDPQEVEVARTIATNHLFYSGDLVRAGELITRIHETANLRAHSQHLAWCYMLRARSSLVIGEPNQAIANCENALPLLAPLPDSFSHVIFEGIYASAL